MNDHGGNMERTKKSGGRIRNDLNTILLVFPFSIEILSCCSDPNERNMQLP